LQPVSQDNSPGPVCWAPAGLSTVWSSQGPHPATAEGRGGLDRKRDGRNWATRQGEKEREGEMMRQMLEAAIAYAEGGWPVFPVFEPLESGGCSCGNPECDSPGKHPRIHGGLTAATLDKAQIREWWQRWETANIGLATAHVLALDVDPRHGGDVSLTTLEHEHGPLPETVTALTGSGGHHYLFQQGRKLVGNAVNLGGYSGLDVRGWGGYVVIPPSQHVSGQRYAWERDPIHHKLAEPPAWFKALLTARRSLPQCSTGNGHSWVQAALQGVPEGQRNETAARLAGYFLHVTHRNMEATRQILHLWAAQCTPPLDERELDRVIESIARRDLLSTAETPGLDAASLAVPLHDLTVAVEAFLGPPPPLEWDIDGIRVRVDHGFTGGAPKTMKGLWSLEEGRAQSTGTPFLGHFSARKARVLYISEEDRVERLHRRVNAMLAGRPLPEIPGPEDLRFLIKAGVRLDTPEGVRILSYHLERWRPEVVFLEHFDKLHSKNPNAPEDMKPILDSLDRMHQEFGCAFRVQKHHRKESMGQSKRKGEMLSGTQALFGWGESSVSLTLLRRGVAQVDCEAKDGDVANRFLIEYRDGRLEYAGEVRGDRQEQKKELVIEFLKEHPNSTTAQVAEVLKRTERTARKLLGTMESDGLVVGKLESSKQPKRWHRKSLE